MPCPPPHVEPRRVVPQLHDLIRAAGGSIEFQSEQKPQATDGIVIDCRGLAARDQFPDLRGVKGEEIIVETDEIELSRPVRLMHPRWPLYIIPRENNRFMAKMSAKFKEMGSDVYLDADKVKESNRVL